MTGKPSFFDRMMRPVKPKLVGDYLPEPRCLADGIWVLERRLRFPPGLAMPTNMTIVRLPTGGLALISPVVTDAITRAQVERLGRVEALIAPNSFHYVYLNASKEAFPEAEVFLPPGLRERIEALPDGTVLHGEAPDRWEGNLEPVLFGPVQNFSEITLVHRSSRTLILTDLAFHMVHIDGAMTRAGWRLFGVPSQFGPSRTGRMSLLRDRGAARPHLERILAMDFERIVVAHGGPLETNARGEFQRAFREYISHPLT